MTSTAAETGLEIRPGDIGQVKLGTTFTKNALKNAKRLNGSLGLDVEGVTTLDNQVGALASAIAERDGRAEETGDDKLPLFIPSHLIRAARIGVGLVYGGLVKEKKDKIQGKFQLGEVREIESRVKQLDRLLKELGGEPELALEDEDDEDEE